MTTKDWARHEGVAVFMRRPDGGVYMAKRTAKDRPFCGLYAAPGGSVEFDETTLAAAVRELKEETGLVVDPERLVLIHRTGPHLTPIEQQGSGSPYHMTYFGLNLNWREKPEVTEPHKQGPWAADGVVIWETFEDELCPGSLAAMTEFDRMFR